MKIIISAILNDPRLSVVFLALIVLGTSVVLKVFMVSNGGYKQCFGCHKKLSWFRQNYHAQPYCCEKCKQWSHSIMKTDAIARIWQANEIIRRTR